MKLKIQLYILSLWLLFLLLLINKLDIPYCIDDDCKFIGFQELLKLNIIPVVCFIFIVAGFIFYYKFKYIISGAP